MLEYTFQHIEGFGALKEKQLWKRKILTWDDYDTKYNTQLNFAFEDTWSPVEESRIKLVTSDVDYFVERLSPHLYYRVAHSFPSRTIFLDIETTGLSRYYDKVTIVGWSVLDKFKVHITGDEASKKELLEDLEECSCIVTFNGSLFDLPFLRMLLPEAKIPSCHVDLRFFSRRVGLQGGQKIVEDLISFQRPKELLDVDGLEATILWHKYKEGDAEALKKLIKYNSFDIDGMKVIFEEVTAMLLKQEKSLIDKSKVFPFSKYVSTVEFAEKQGELDKIFIPAYEGKVGPCIYLQDLPDLSAHRIVGIDLTGSEAKATGWAVLENNVAKTKTILTDQELIEETIKLKPSVISIDSPLSLPAGRVSVFDDDPGRNKYGITRECERIMAKRGVKSYPCLIQSMQKLTLRGIKLANEFRRLGYPVIESYPGAAQDILGIPRKGKSLEYLIKGLKCIGLDGRFVDAGVTHDEIDAITSALVGYFFLAEKYEGLGNENENFLIIPRLENSKPDKTVVIGISGLLATGKTTSGKILEKLGFGYGRYSMVIDSCLAKEGKSINRTNQQEAGDFINKNKGQRWLGNELIKLLPKEKNLVIDGLRFKEDHSFLKELYGLNFFHIHLTADEDKRKERYYTKEQNDKKFEEAVVHGVENEIIELQNFADLVVTNNSTIEDLEIELKQIISTICQYQ